MNDERNPSTGIDIITKQAALSNHCDGCDRVCAAPLSAYKPYRITYNLCRDCMRELKRNLRQSYNRAQLRRTEDQLLATAGRVERDA